MVLWPYTTMDDEGLPLSSPLPLSRPAAQALNDNPDAPLSPESTGGDGSQASDTGGNATAGGRTTAHVASLHGAAATARRRKGEERRGREAPCATTRRKEMALVWGGGREQRAEVGGPRRAAAASPLARACSGCRWGGVGRARSGHGVETLCASRSVRPPYRPRRGAGGCWSEQQTKTKASRAQRGYGPSARSWCVEIQLYSSISKAKPAAIAARR